MELLTLTILIFGFYALCTMIGVANPIRILLIILGFLVVVISAYFTFYDTLSKPKDVSLEFFRNDENVKVMAFSIDPGVALYTLLSLDGVSEPRYYRFEWSPQTQEMARALIEGQEQNQEMVISKPFESSLSTEKVAHPEPQPKMPDKQVPQNNVIKLEEE